jgi:O-methyltransferase involved in polyketide biosynthesis
LQIVLFGAGYDTRALRYRHTHGDKLQFIEVDLPDVVDGKQRLYQKFARDDDPEWDFENNGSNFVPFDLNECGGSKPESLIEVLKQRGGLREDIPTLFVFEAVLFYVEEDAIRNIMDDLVSFMGSWQERGAEALLCMTGAYSKSIPRGILK